LKNKIIDETIELSNEMGLHRVTTNHVIEYLGISPGTFYYHFKNKEEIIRKIFDRIIKEFDCLLVSDFSSPEIIDCVRMMAGIYYKIYYKYRSFYYELSMLLDRDGILAGLYKINYRIKISRLYTLTLLLEKQGVLKQLKSEEERYYFIRNQWVMNDCCFLFFKSTGETISEDIVLEGINCFFMFIKPYLTQSAVDELDIIFRDNKIEEILI